MLSYPEDAPQGDEGDVPQRDAPQRDPAQGDALPEDGPGSPQEEAEDDALHREDAGVLFQRLAFLGLKAILLAFAIVEGSKSQSYGSPPGPFQSF